jgi:hypothetical protein
MLLAFSFAIVRARARLGDRLPCACFGRERSRDYRLLLLRNAGLAMVAGMVAAGAPVVDVSAIRAPEGSEWLPATLSLTGAAAAFAMLRTASVLRRPASAGR